MHVMYKYTSKSSLLTSIKDRQFVVLPEFKKREDFGQEEGTGEMEVDYQFRELSSWD